MHYDVVILGGGAAGLMCAHVAGRRGRRVRVIDHANRVGKKILMSGGGRCNFTNLHSGPGNFLSANPHFCKSALARYTPADFIALVDRHGIAWHEKEQGQLFCDDSSKQIVRLLLDECADAGVDVSVNCAIEAVTREAGGFLVQTRDTVTERKAMLHADAVVVATGGLSIPKMGATGFGYALARQFGHAIVPTRAGLVPLTLSGRPLEELQELAGIAVPEVCAGADGTEFRSALLFTHRGLSGPAILQISSYWTVGDPLRLNLLPGLDLPAALEAAQRERPAAELKTVLGEWLPKRLAQRWCELQLPNRPMRQYRRAELQALAASLQSWTVTPSGTEGYRTAEVTLGGVDTDELSSSTMQSRLQPGLYFIGEVVDVTGHLGGHNFQWAWASGHAAGQAV